jgi:undecaprenyl diphosphate synthase
MKRSSALPAACHGIHVGIIMDGNGRWAVARGLPRTAGHHAGVRTARKIVEEAVRAGVGTVTLYAFSADNWSRPSREVALLMRLLRRSLYVEAKRCVENGVRLTILGRRDRLPPAVITAIEDAEASTAHGRHLHLRVAIDYSARDAILRAVQQASGQTITREGFTQLLAVLDHDKRPARDVDLLIRTGGEQRLSDFMLWECAYAELLFVPTPWPDFGATELDAALREYRRRDRRFGMLAPAAALAG